MTADELYRLHERLSRARLGLEATIGALLHEAGYPEGSEGPDVDEDLADLEDAEDQVFEAYCDAVRREAGAA